MGYRVIITGTTGMVGEGVMLECLANDKVSAVFSVSRKTNGYSHPKLKEYLVPDFLALTENNPELAGYDACFFCAGVSSIGMNEADYTRMTYDTTISFAKAVLAQNPGITFIYVSGASTDSTEKGKQMWARVKGRTENDLARMPFKKVHNFRPGFMKTVPGQKFELKAYKYFAWSFPIFKLLMPNVASTLNQVGRAMINTLAIGTDKTVLEVKDINELGNK